MDRGDNYTHLVQACLALKRRLERLAARHAATADRCTKEIDAIAYELEQCLDGCTASGRGNGQRRPLSRAAAEHQVLQEQAAAGATHVEARPHAGGGIDIRIDGRKWLRLPPMPGELLRILIEPGQPPAADGLPAYRPYSDLALRLTKVLGRKVARKDITQVVHKLRRAFRAAGENWFLIQTNRTRGLRFALRAPRAAGTEE